MLRNKQIEKNELSAFFMGFLGFTLASNIVYVCSVGSTHFKISEVYSVVLFAYLILTSKVNWRNISQIMGLAFKMFCVTIVFSGVFAFITFTSVSLMYRFVVGIISFGICLTTMIDVIILFDYRKSFAKGCVIGIILNGLICAIQYIFYQSNVSFTILYELFPQDSFHLSIYNFAAQGLFLEPSHMNQFLASVVPICIGFIGLKKIGNKLFLAIVLMCCALSTSGTAAVILLGLILLVIIEKPFGRYVSKKGFVLTCILGVIIMLVIIFYSDSPVLTNIINNVSRYIKLSVEGSNIRDASNAERVKSMQAAIDLIPENLLGCGWNMVHTLLQQKSNLNTASAFSDILEMILEIGVFGVALYITSIFESIAACLRLRTHEASGVATAIICMLIMSTLADYAINPCIMSVLALGMCFRREYIILKQKRQRGDKK